MCRLLVQIIEVISIDLHKSSHLLTSPTLYACTVGESQIHKKMPIELEMSA